MKKNWKLIYTFVKLNYKNWKLIKIFNFCLPEGSCKHPLQVWRVRLNISYKFAGFVFTWPVGLEGSCPHALQVWRVGVHMPCRSAGLVFTCPVPWKGSYTSLLFIFFNIFYFVINLYFFYFFNFLCTVPSKHALYLGRVSLKYTTCLFF